MNAPNHRSLDQLVQSAHTAIRTLETEIASLASEIGDLNARYTQERIAVQQEREEKDIYYSLETGTPYLVSAPDTVELRAHEKELVEISIRAATLERSLSDFGSVLAFTSRQFESDGELPDVDSATELSLRIARIQAQEEERRRFAREIHDGPAQAFANAIIGLEFVERAIKTAPGNEPTPALGEIERIKGSMREGLTEIRRFMFDLKPSMLLDRGLVPTIEHYVDAYRSILPMRVELNTDADLPRMLPEQEMTAFRVIQESLHNATKYARASRVVVDIKMRTDETITISIEDDGRGFDPSQVTAHPMGGTGIQGMRERAELVGGTFHVESAVGHGTSVYLVLPSVH